MKLRYDILITPDPIKLSIGLLKKPALRDISRITFERAWKGLLGKYIKVYTNGVLYKDAQRLWWIRRMGFNER